MAKQSSLLKITGKLDDLIFYKTRDGYVVRRKYAGTGKRVKHDPAYERFREHQSEFGRAGKAARLIRTALYSQLHETADYQMTSRLVRDLHAIIRSDTVNLRGMRTITDGNIKLLEGFDFNINAPFKRVFHAPYNITVDNSGRSFILHLPAFTPAKTISFPEYATHAELCATAVALNFDEENYDLRTTEKLRLQKTDSTTPDLSWPLPAPTKPDDIMCVALSLRFFQNVNNNLLPLMNSLNNSLSLIMLQP